MHSASLMVWMVMRKYEGEEDEEEEEEEEEEAEAALPHFRGGAAGKPRTETRGSHWRRISDGASQAGAAAAAAAAAAACSAPDSLRHARRCA